MIESIELYFQTISYWHWLSLAITLVIFDLLLGVNFFLIWLGICAASIALILGIYSKLDWNYQVLIFALESIASIVLWRIYLKKNPIKTDKPNLNRRSEQYIGRIFTLQAPIVDRCGKIKVDDSIWKISGPDLQAGEKVKVTAVNGVILEVERYIE